MNIEKSPSVKWKFLILPLIAVTLISVLPQLNLWIKRGVQWNGAYATLHGDEFLYSAYLNALIDNRPRRNDPFMGTDLANRPLPETTFSIQLVPAVALSSVARLLRLSSSKTFVALTVISGWLAAISLFWLLLSMTRNSLLAGTGVLFVLCLGTIAAKQGLLGLLLDRDLLIFGLPFLRRYQPAASFFLFFVFVTLVWRALTTESNRFAWLQRALAGLALVLLIFSYLYLWTAALAWLVCLAVLSILIGSPTTRVRSIRVFITIGVMAATALVLYGYLVSHRSHTLDSAQTLINTHQPDLFRIPEIVGLVVVVGLLLAWRKGKVELGSPTVLFCAAFALLPLVVFNQQIITGRSMQPYHFEGFIANYAALVGVFILVTIIWTPIPKRALVWIAGLCFLWGLIEVDLPIRAYSAADIVKDEAVPALRRLNELGKQSGVLRQTIVFSPRSEIMLTLPTWAPQGTLLAIGSLDFGSISQAERRELFYSYLYFSNVDAKGLHELFDGKTDDSFLKYYVRSAIFGHERALPSLSQNFRPIEPNEIQQAINEFEDYTRAFSLEEAKRTRYTYLITRADSEGDLSRIDHWYERGPVEQVGKYKLYVVNLRSESGR